MKRRLRGLGVLAVLLTVLMVACSPTAVLASAGEPADTEWTLNDVVATFIFCGLFVAGCAAALVWLIACWPDRNR